MFICLSTCVPILGGGRERERERAGERQRERESKTCVRYICIYKCVYTTQVHTCIHIANIDLPYRGCPRSLNRPSTKNRQINAKVALWGVHFLGVLIVRCLPFWVYIEALMFANSHVAGTEAWPASAEIAVSGLATWAVLGGQERSVCIHFVHKKSKHINLSIYLFYPPSVYVWIYVYICLSLSLSLCKGMPSEFSK